MQEEENYVREEEKKTKKIINYRYTKEIYIHDNFFNREMKKMM